MAEGRTELSTLGEFGMIQRIHSNNKIKNVSTIKAIGDDAAVIDCGTHYQLISTDFLVEGIHFDLSYVPLKHLGYKSVAVNVSDIVAMNGKAEQITVSIAVSNRFSVEALDELYVGIQAACENYNVDLVGGDTTSSTSGLIISVTAIGKVNKDKVVYRNGAKPEEVVCLSGDLGGAYIGLQILEREKQVFLSDPDMKPDLTTHEYVIERQLKPEARADFIFDLAEKGVVPTSMIDVSDGLASELLHICTQSGVGVKVFDEQLPIDDATKSAAMEINLDATTAALNGGEDYELLFTVTQADFEKIRLLPEVFPIGITTKKEAGLHIVTPSGRSHELKAQGWVHF